MNFICTICARGNSKGVINKALKKIQGTPLIAITIKQALSSNLFDEVVVSTDSKKIQKVAVKYGAKSWFLRSKNLSNDYSSKILAIRDVFSKSEIHFNKKFDICVDLDITSPLRNINDIKKSLKLFISKKKMQNLFSVCEARRNPYFNMVEIVNKKLKRVKPLKKNIFRRQDAPKTYDCNASIYIWKKKSLLNFKTFYKSKTVLYVMPEERSWDIDNNFDFKIVKFLLKKK